MLHDVAAGMMYLHKRLYVHGDLRSPNLFVGQDGRVRSFLCFRGALHLLVLECMSACGDPTNRTGMHVACNMVKYVRHHKVLRGTSHCQFMCSM